MFWEKSKWEKFDVSMCSFRIQRIYPEFHGARELGGGMKAMTQINEQRQEPRERKEENKRSRTHTAVRFRR